MAEQSNINPNPNQAMLGLNTDNISQQVKPGSLTYALNAQVDSFDGQMITYQNEQSNVLCSDFKAGYKVIGFHSIVEQERSIIFLANPYTGDSEIGMIDNKLTCDVDDSINLNEKKSNNYVNNGYNNIDSACSCDASEPILTFYDLYKKLNPQDTLQMNTCCTYTTLVNAKCLNFNINNPIHSIVHRIVDINDDADKCGTEIYWADGLNPRRFINLSNLPYLTAIIDCDRVKSNVIDCDLIDVQPTVVAPCITPVRVNDGGSLVAGSYQFAIQYTNDQGEGYTSYFSITNSIGIFRSRYGLDYNFQTDQSIKLFISGLDTKFKYFNIAVLKTINGITDTELAGTYEILKDTAEVVYSGNNKTQINLTIDDIFAKNPYYGAASEVSSVGNTLMWANVKSTKRISYQSIASAINLKWGTYQLLHNDQEGYRNGINSALYRGYMRDEVYAFEIVFTLKNGQQTDGFHIPGRASMPGDLDLINNDDVIVKSLNCIDDVDIQPRWKVYNTGSLIGNEVSYDAAPNTNCYIGPYQYGEFSYWESEKLYPCDPAIWGDLANTPIRHHKFPDSLITHIHDSNPNAKDKNFEHKIYPIDVRIDMNNIQSAIRNSSLNDSQKSEIVGFKIIRSDRVNNKSVIAKGLLYNVGAYTPYSAGAPVVDQDIFYPNYPFNDLSNNDPFLTNLSSVNDGGFSIGLVDSIENDLDTIQSQIDSLEALTPTIPVPVCYTAIDTCVADPMGIPIIEITLAEVADLQNLVFIANGYRTDLTNAIQVVTDYYNEKVANNEPICMDDVADLTVPSVAFNNYLDALDDITGSAAMVKFASVVSYINTNAATLVSHPKATDVFSLRTILQNLLTINASIMNSQVQVDDGITEYEAALVELSSVSCAGGAIGDSAFSATRFTFHSPDTHFYQPFLGSILKFETVEGGPSIGNFVQVKDHAGHKLISSFSAGIALIAGIAVGALFALEPRQYVIGSSPGPRITFYAPAMPSVGTIAEKALFWNKQFKEMIDNLIPYKNYAYQYNAIGLYNQFEPVANAGFKQRALDKAYYLLPGMQTLGDIFPINNWKRESSVFFKTDQLSSAPKFPNDPTMIGGLEQDNSRIPYSSNKQIYSNVLSYYASHKRKLLDQYGDMYSYNTVDTAYCGKINLIDDYTGVVDYIFGGDVFINRFGLKRKLSFFLDTAVDKPDNIDFLYSDLSNVGKARYWYNTSSEQIPNSGFKGLMKSLLGVPQSNLDGNTNKLFYQNGRIYLYAYGIAYFFVESEVNVDFRQAGNTKEKDFYPNVGTGIPNDWLQETEVPIVEDNYYIYNKTYSKQNKENFFTHLPLSFDATQECEQDFSYRVIYSDPNKWRVYKPISFYDFPKNYGALTSIDAIDNQQVLVRFENKSFIYNALTAIQTTSGKYAYLGNDDVFKSQPIDFGETDLGYAGSQHRFLLKTEAGHLFIDAKRGMIFLITGKNITPISETGMQKWFGRNLTFEIDKHFPVNVDNHFNGVGITGTWDNQFNRFIITKLDYEPIASKKVDMRYDKYYGKFFYKNAEILLDDPTYFCNKSWTISYSPVTKSWVSFHSYIPNFYIGLNGKFLTGKNTMFNNQKSSVWLHNVIHTSYQRFYGQLKPYVLEYPFVYKGQDEVIQNVKDYTTILEYYNENDFYEINDNVYFNKAILWNNQQTSGILNLFPKPKGRLNDYFKYPIFKPDSKDIIFTKSDNFFNYNTFWDVVKNPNNHYPIWVESCENKSVDKMLNNDKLDYSTRSHQKTRLRAKDLKIRHINDYHDRYKFISKFLLAPSQISIK